MIHTRHYASEPQIIEEMFHLIMGICIHDSGLPRMSLYICQHKSSWRFGIVNAKLQIRPVKTSYIEFALRQTQEPDNVFLHHFVGSRSKSCNHWISYSLYYITYFQIGWTKIMPPLGNTMGFI